MSQSQEFKSQAQDMLKAGTKAKPESRPDEYHELSNQNTNTQMRKDLMEEAAYMAYDAVASHKTFQHQQKSYNEVREQYEEQAYSSEETHMPQTEQETQQTGTESGKADERGGSRSQSESAAGMTGSGAPENHGPEPESGRTWKSPTMREVESRESGSMFGTAESPKLAQNTQLLSKNAKLQQNLENRRRYVQKGYTRLTLGEKDITNERLKLRYYGRIKLTGEAEIAHLGRLKYKSRIVKEKMTTEDYEELLNRKAKRSFKRRTRGRLLFQSAKRVAEDESLPEDEMIGDMKRKVKRAGRADMTATRRNIRTIKDQNNVYIRLDRAKQQEQVLKNKREKLMSDAKRKQQKEQIRAAQSRAQKKKLKKQMIQMRVREEGNFLRRTRHGMMVKRSARKLQKQAVKKTMSTIISVIGVGAFFLIVGLILFLVLLAAFAGGTEYYAETVTQNDYDTITDATEYFRKLETDLDEYLNADREALEAELEAEYGSDIYEYIYNLADFGFFANTLIAYLSAVYGSFTLEDIKEELHSIFEEMYTLTIEVKVEDRVNRKYDPDTDTYEDVTEPKNICYITLEKKELEDVVEPRMTPEQLELYKGYRLSTGGQQVYGPVMREDWTNLISSNFGERIHPITKERKMHKGVDIAIPVGTHLYSAVDGTVTLAEYSESAGNWVKVQTDTGFTVVMMHMDSLTVSKGQVVKRGDHLGYSGNTGRSTGPHLHLEVRNPEDKPLNPIFIIPQTCVVKGTGTEE